LGFSLGFKAYNERTVMAASTAPAAPSKCPMLPVFRV
jgi:hypothetical protein